MIIAIDLPLDKQYFFVLEAVIIETNELCEGVRSWNDAFS
jgi:hypothetical protein